jgi:di/tricarboxylate transporter
VQFGPWIALSIVVLISSILTNFLSHTAVAALLVPIALETAHVVHASPRAFLMAVTLGASACFASPIAHQTNTLVYGAGGYRFGDFMRFGLPLNLLYWILASILIPVFWPL